VVARAPVLPAVRELAPAVLVVAWVAVQVRVAVMAGDIFIRLVQAVRDLSLVLVRAGVFIQPSS
jgi:hypothetical protein